MSFNTARFGLAVNVFFLQASTSIYASASAKAAGI